MLSSTINGGMDDSISPIEVAKRLVRTVGKAFYADETYVILEALLRDRHLRDSDMDTRIGLGAKLVRRLLAELLDEHLIRTEEVLDEASGKRELYYYIDFNHFTNVVRYRVHLMHREVERMEKEANDNQTYECPECGRTLTVLEVQPLRNKRYGFCCPTCCNNELHSQCEGDRWQLRPRQAVAGFEEVQALKDKLRKQMYQAAERSTNPAPHEGLYNILSQLEHKALPSNLPSEVIALSLSASAEGGGGERKKGRRGGGAGGEGGMGSVFEDLASSTRDGRIQADEEGGEAFLNVIRPARAQPEFLQGSRVIKEDATTAVATAAAMMKKEEQAQVEEKPVEMTEAERLEAYKRAYVEALQKELGGGSGGGLATNDAAATHVKTEERVEAAVAEEEDDDVDWEEAEG